MLSLEKLKYPTLLGRTLHAGLLGSGHIPNSTYLDVHFVGWEKKKKTNRGVAQTAE